jgi:hypothetical protein
MSFSLWTIGEPDSPPEVDPDNHLLISDGIGSTTERTEHGRLVAETIDKAATTIHLLGQDALRGTFIFEPESLEWLVGED